MHATPPKNPIAKLAMKSARTSAQSRLRQEPIEVDPIDARRPRRRGHVLIVAREDLLQVAALDEAHPLLAHLAQRTRDVDRRRRRRARLRSVRRSQRRLLI